MGAISFSIDVDLVAFLARHLPLEIFVETGTFEGDSIDRVKPYFRRFYSVELSEHYAGLAQKRFAEDPNITIACGHAPDFLKGLAPALKSKSVLFWLDSHWCDAAATGGATSQCSLPAELHAIEPLGEDSVILIDDARLFLCPPGVPHDYTQWPDFTAIVQALHEKGGFHDLMVFNDVIMLFPRHLKEKIRRYAHEHGADWLTIADMSRQTGEVIAELDAKEKEIKALTLENTILVGETRAKENEIQLKQLEINNMFSVAEQRLAVINQFESAREAIRSGFSENMDRLQAIIEEKQGRIDDLHLLVAEKDRHLAKVEAIAESRLQVIREQENAINALRRRRIKERLRLWMQPRLGILYHYPPRPMKIPNKYLKEQNKKPIPGGWPAISIVTPSFNQADFIERTLQSLFQQHYPRLEYIIQDGGSSDGTVDILKKHEARLARWVSEKDEGQSAALNTGFAHATGDIMAYLNSDDMLLPGALHYVARYFSAHPDIDVVYGHRVLMDEYDQEIGRWVMPPHDDAVLSWADYIPQETMFWRRRIWEKAGGRIDAAFKFAMDWDLILRFRDAGARIVRLPRFLGAFRIHPHQKTSAEISRQGEMEMGILRERCHGRKVSDAEVYQHIKAYLYRHVLLQKLYRAGILRY